MKKTTVYFKDNKSLLINKKKYFENNILESITIIEQSEKKKSLSFLTADKDIDVKEINSFFSNIDEVSQEDYDVTEKFPFFSEPLFFYNAYKKVIRTITDYLCSTSYFKTTVEKQNILVSNLFMAVANTHSEGLSHGYISYYSNLKYFLTQLKTICTNNELSGIKKSIFHMSEEEKNYTIQSNNIDDLLIVNIQNLSNYLKSNSTKIKKEKLPSPEFFFENSKISMEYSEFHKYVFTNKILIQRYKNVNFYIYRIIMDMYFRILPLLGVSLARRNHIIYLFISRMEKRFNINWENQLEESIRIEENVN